MTYEKFIELIESQKLKVGSVISWKGHENIVMAIDFDPEYPVRDENRKRIGTSKEVTGFVFGFKLNQRRKFGWVTIQEVKNNIKDVELI